jgi:hypothetical protein
MRGGFTRNTSESGREVRLPGPLLQQRDIPSCHPTNDRLAPGAAAMGNIRLVVATAHSPTSSTQSATSA